MREEQFRSYLENNQSIKSKDKAVQSRITRAKMAEELLNGVSLDDVVSDDRKMYAALSSIKASKREINGTIQNAVRWYYKFVNGKEFPRMASYETLA